MTENEDPSNPAVADADIDEDMNGAWDDEKADPNGSEEIMGMPRKKAILIAQIALVVLALLVVAAIVISNGGGDDDGAKSNSNGESADTTDAKDAKAQWPANVSGRPPALGKRGEPAPDVVPAKGAKPGVYLWNDFDGWHLWVVTGAGLPAVKGTLTSNDPIGKAELAVPDAGTVLVDEQVVTFSFPSDKPIVGMDFNPGFFAKNLVFTLDGPDGPIPQKQVFIGSKATQAPYPLVITKSAS